MTDEYVKITRVRALQWTGHNINELQAFVAEHHPHWRVRWSISQTEAFLYFWEDPYDETQINPTDWITSDRLCVKDEEFKQNYFKVLK